MTSTKIMPIKEIKLLARDLCFYVTGGADVAAADYAADDWLYPLDWDYQLRREADYFDPKDESGIPLRDYGGTLGRQYLISRIAGYGLGHWNRWRLLGSEASRAAFMQLCERFPKAAPGGRYEHRFAVAGMNVPWISCISQGEAASVFSRAYVQTGDPQWLVKAAAAVQPLLISVEDGGLQSRLPDGRPFVEEYPGTQYRHVLNGCLYALVGVSDVLRAAPVAAPEHQQLFDGIIDALAHNITVWDVDGWSTYDYPFTPGVARNSNTMTYQVLQSTLLHYLGTVSRRPELLAMAERWEAAAASRKARLRALAGKLRYRARTRW